MATVRDVTERADDRLECQTTEGEVGAVELPSVVSDWDALVSRAGKMVKVIDQHLDYESIYQGHNLTPAGLCPQQRVNMVSDLACDAMGG